MAKWRYGDMAKSGGEQPPDFTLNQSSLMIRAPCALLLLGCIGLGCYVQGGQLALAASLHSLRSLRFERSLRSLRNEDLIPGVQ